MPKGIEVSTMLIEKPFCSCHEASFHGELAIRGIEKFNSQNYCFSDTLEFTSQKVPERHGRKHWF